MTKSKASRILLRELAASLMESFSCDPDVCDESPNRCPCGGDDCWNCAAAQALDPPGWSRAMLADRLKAETALINARANDRDEKPQGKS